MKYSIELMQNNSIYVKKYKGSEQCYAEENLLNPEFDEKMRIIQSSAFMNLSQKSHCIFDGNNISNSSYLINALTSANNASTIAKAVGADENLCESICLAMHTGYPALGYFGAQSLHREMDKQQKSFNVLTQSLIVTTKLEKICPEFNGLNLSANTIAELAKHAAQQDTASLNTIQEATKHIEITFFQQNSIEGQIAAITTNFCETMQKIGALLQCSAATLQDLKQLPLLGDAVQAMENAGYKNFQENFYQILIHKANCILVKDVVQQTKKNLENVSRASLIEDSNSQSSHLAAPSDHVKRQIEVIKIFIKDIIAKNSKIQLQKHKVFRVITTLFDFLQHNPMCIPVKWQVMHMQSNKICPESSACNYITSMTDADALNFYQKLT